jgi:FAD/FMN-containing dehydrogenase
LPPEPDCGRGRGSAGESGHRSLRALRTAWIDRSARGKALRSRDIHRGRRRPGLSREFYAELITRAPRELGVELSLAPNEDDTPGAQIYVVYSGDAKSGANVLEPLQRFGTPIRNTIGPQSYLEVQTWFDPPPINPTHWYLKRGFVREYSPGLLALLADEFRPDAGTNMYFQSANGAVADVPQTATAFSHRGAIANMMLFGVWKDASQDEAGRKAIRAIWSKLAPSTDGCYVNLHDTDSRDKGAHSNYGANLTRLATLKKQFDPMNLFHLNANIHQPESAGTR